jgi:hypothetical protein
MIEWTSAAVATGQARRRPTASRNVEVRCRPAWSTDISRARGEQTILSSTVAGSMRSATAAQDQGSFVGGLYPPVQKVLSPHRDTYISMYGAWACPVRLPQLVQWTVKYILPRASPPNSVRLRCHLRPFRIMLHSPFQLLGIRTTPERDLRKSRGCTRRVHSRHSRDGSGGVDPEGVPVELHRRNAKPPFFWSSASSSVLAFRSNS